MARPGNIHIPSLETLVNGLLTKLQEAHYGSEYILTHLRIIRPIQTYMDSIGATDYTPDIGQQYLEQYFITHHPCESSKGIIINAFQFLNDYYYGKPIVRRASSKIYNTSLNSLLFGLTAQLKDEGYSESTIRNYEVRLRPLQTFMAANHITDYTPDVGFAYLNHVVSTRKISEVHKRELYASIARLNDIMNGQSLRAKHASTNSAEIPAVFRSTVQSFFKDPDIVSDFSSTIRRRTRALSSFLRVCMECGMQYINEITAHMVLLACRQITNVDDYCTIRQFLKYLVKNGIVATDYSLLVPVVRRDVKAPSIYSVEEMRRLESTIDTSTLKGKRDLIVLLLADRLAIRTGDIARLKKSNLDFQLKTISFEQQKTGAEIILPMIPEIYDAFIDYFSVFLPKGDHVFYCTTAPFRPLTASAVYGIVNRCFKAAGIETAGKKHGAHALRASVSTSMINDNIPYEAVRDVLGHRSPESIRHYAKNDVDKLRRCAIPVPAPSGNFAAFLNNVVKDGAEK